MGVFEFNWIYGFFTRQTGEQFRTVFSGNCSLVKTLYICLLNIEKQFFPNSYFSCVPSQLSEYRKFQIVPSYYFIITKKSHIKCLYVAFSVDRTNNALPSIFNLQ